MARVLQQLVEPPRECGYLPDREAALEYRLMVDVTPPELETLLVRGWRRFGPIYFRPACDPCGECVSIRIPVDRFTPDRSQRRARKKADRFRRVIGAPRVDAERLDLYARWHAFREDRRGWEGSELDADEYFRQFAFPHPAAREIATYEGDRLASVSLCDVTPQAWSAVYFFYDPEIASTSPGIANVLLCVELARERGIPYVYLGYRVEGCASMRYKGGFQPHELLVGRPSMEEEPRWVEGIRSMTIP